MRNISFALTTEQVRKQTKTVTRRLGWKNLRPGDILQACVKCQGLKKGEHPEKIGLIHVLNVRREPLAALLDDSTEGLLYGVTECDKEGFPKMSPNEFVRMFCLHNSCLPGEKITRIEFRYL